MVTFQKEDFMQVFSEATELLRGHYEEVAERQDVIPLDPDVARYQKMFDMDMLEIHTAREDGKLIGYSAWFVCTNMHYKTSLTASSDVIYISPEHRKGMVGARFIKWTTQEIKKRNPQRILCHVQPSVDFGPILERLGANYLEKIYSLVLE